MPAFVSYIPIATTLVAVLFAPVVFRRWRERRSGPHLLWWSAGILIYGVGTFTEAFVSVFGWNVPEDTILAVIGLIAVAVGAEGYKDGKAMEGTTPPVVK